MNVDRPFADHWIIRSDITLNKSLYFIPFKLKNDVVGLV